MGSQAYGRCMAAAQASMAIGQSGAGGMKKDLYHSVAILPPPGTLQFTLRTHLFFSEEYEGRNRRKSTYSSPLPQGPGLGQPLTTGNVLYKAMNPTVQGDVYISS